MFMEINGTIKVINNEIMLIIAQDDFKKFQEYENILSSKKFYAGFSLGNKQLYITGLFEKEKKNQEDNIVIMPISSANKQGNGKAFTTATEIKTLLGLDNTKKEVEVQMLQHPQKQLEELKPKIQELEAANKKAENDKTELQAQLDTAQQEKQDLEAEVEKLKAIDSTALQQQLEEKNAKITELEALDAVALQQKLTEKENEITALKAQPDAAQLKDKDEEIKTANAAVTKLEGEKTTLTNKIKDLEAQLNNQPDAAQLKDKDEEIKTANAAVTKLEGEKTTLTNKIKDLEAQLNNQPDAAQLQAKDEKIKDLEAQLSNQPNAVQLQAKEDKIKELEAKINQPNAEVESLKKDLQAQNARVHQLEKENKELEAKNKTIKQPKQGNGARYTATVGVGLAAGLIAFTALEHTVRLEMLVIIGIAVTSALVAGGITYAALPSTQVDGVKAQEVSGDKKSKS